MTKSHIGRDVARTTGESRRTIARYGFSLLDDDPSPLEDDNAIVLECGGCGRLVRLAPWQCQTDEPEAECLHCDAVYDVTPDELFAINTQTNLAACA